MGTLYIFTAGTSLYTNLEKDNRAIPYKDFLDKWLANHSVELLLADSPDILEAANLMFTYYGKDNAQQSTAELTSFFQLNLTNDDQVVLLSSDTKEGLFCALVTAHLMSSPSAVEPVVLWDKPGTHTKSINWRPLSATHAEKFTSRARPWVAVMRIPSLDPSKAEGFTNKAVGNLVLAMARLVKYARGCSPALEPVIVFTGGFKVSLPVLTQAAACLDGVPMFGLREDSDQMITIPVLSMELSPRLVHGILGWAWHAGRDLGGLTGADRKKLNDWAEATSRDYAELSGDLKPAFSKKDGNEVTLNILGEALLAVILADLPVHL